MLFLPSHRDFSDVTLLVQGLNTTGTLVLICQNSKFNFSFLTSTYLGLAQAVTSTISTLGFWYIQRYWKIGTKKMASDRVFFQNGFSLPHSLPLRMP